MDDSAQTPAAIRAMEAALGAGSDDMSAHSHAAFLWRDNRGCGVKQGLGEFRRNWQLPLRAAFSDRVYRTGKMIAQGDWAAVSGHIEATHSGVFMGIAPTGQRQRIPCMDFWRVEEGRIKDNPVFVDIAAIPTQFGRDVIASNGWEAFDDGASTSPMIKDRP